MSIAEPCKINTHITRIINSVTHLHSFTYTTIANIARNGIPSVNIATASADVTAVNANIATMSAIPMAAVIRVKPHMFMMFYECFTMFYECFTMFYEFHDVLQCFICVLQCFANVSQFFMSVLQFITSVS